MMFVNLAMDKMRCMSENQSGINYKILSSHQCYSTTTITATIITTNISITTSSTTTTITAKNNEYQKEDIT